MNALEFLRAFYPKFRATPPQGKTDAWTDGIRRILHALGEEAGYLVHCDKFEKDGTTVGFGEFRDLDFSYWDKKRYETIRGWYKDIWVPPHVVIEHENIESPFVKKLEDFFKACLFVSQLRVFIGYTPKKTGTDGPDDQAKQMTDFYRSHDFRQVQGAETLIMLAYVDDEALDMEWAVRLLGQGGVWQALRLPLP